jgi:hypothetical protein
MTIACHNSLDPLFQTLGIWIQGSGAAGHVSSVTYFSNLLEDKDRRLKIKLTLSLILQVNLRVSGYSIWSASSIAPDIKKTGQLIGTWAPHSLDAAKEVLRGHLQEKVQGTQRCLQKYSDACNTRLRRARGLVSPEYMGLYTWHTFPRIRVGTWSMPYICYNYL